MASNEGSADNLATVEENIEDGTFLPLDSVTVETVVQVKEVLNKVRLILYHLVSNVRLKQFLPKLIRHG